MEHVFSNVLQFLIGGKSRPCPDVHALVHHLRRHELLAELERTSYGKRIVLDTAYAGSRLYGPSTDSITPQCVGAMCRQVLRDKKKKHVFQTRRIFGERETFTNTIGVVLYDNRFHLVSLRNGTVTGCLTTTPLDPE